jgi:hypothetical protein
MVIFRSTDGKPGYHQAEGLDEAVRFVERLRNTENVEQARIYKMDEVSFSYKPYYKVEIAGDEVSDPTSAEVPEAAVEHRPVHLDPSEPAPEREPAMVAADDGLPPAPIDGEPVGANGRRGLFGR